MPRSDAANAAAAAVSRSPGEQVAPEDAHRVLAEHGHEAAALAEQARDQAVERRMSFVAETVISHPSKLDLIERAHAPESN